MLQQASSHLSRVCGHGHIKKFWLMQTQKESQSCDSKSSVLFPASTTPRSGSRTSLLGLDSSPRSPPSPIPGYGDAKHPSLTCAETLSSPPQSPNSTLAADGVTQTQNIGEPHISVDVACRTVDDEALYSFTSPHISSMQAVSEHEGKPLLERTTSVTEEELVSFEGIHASDDPLSFSAEDSTNSIASHGYSHPIQNGKGICAVACKVHPIMDVRGCVSPTHTGIGGRDQVSNGKSVSNMLRMSVPRVAVLGTSESGKYHGVSIRNRPHDNDMEQHYQSPHALGGLKACSRCRTTKTPMWRSGPQGPKSLCNACGIRFKKYKAFPGQNGSPEHALGQTTTKVLARPMKRKLNAAIPTSELTRAQKISFKSGFSDHHKRGKWHEFAMRRDQVELNRESPHRWNVSTPPTCFKKIYGCAPFQSKFKKLAPLDEHRSVNRVFAKDEEEAAVLLMHLSCGLVYQVVVAAMVV